MEGEQKRKRLIQMRRKGKKRDKDRDYEAETKHAKTEWVLCSDDWKDIVVTFVPQLINIPIENNYVDIFLEEIEDAYTTYGK